MHDSKAEISYGMSGAFLLFLKTFSSKNQRHYQQGIHYKKIVIKIIMIASTHQATKREQRDVDDC